MYEKKSFILTRLAASMEPRSWQLDRRKDWQRLYIFVIEEKKAGSCHVNDLTKKTCFSKKIL